MDVDSLTQMIAAAPKRCDHTHGVQFTGVQCAVVLKHFEKLCDITSGVDNEDPESKHIATHK